MGQNGSDVAKDASDILICRFIETVLSYSSTTYLIRSGAAKCSCLLCAPKQPERSGYFPVPNHHPPRKISTTSLKYFRIIKDS
jgi:hypothetical protein